MKHHPYSHTTIHHYKDGSGHTHHHHESDSTKDKIYAHMGHDGMMDGLHENLGPEMAGGGGAEEAMEAGAAGGGAPGGM